MAIRAFQTPGKDIVTVDQMASVRILNGGIGIFDNRKNMLGWIEVEDEGQIELASDILLEILNNPRRAKAPDWSFLKESPAPACGSTTVTAASLATQPTRRNSESNS